MLVVTDHTLWSYTLTVAETSTRNSIASKLYDEVILFSEIVSFMEVGELASHFSVSLIGGFTVQYPIWQPCLVALISPWQSALLLCTKSIHDRVHVCNGWLQSSEWQEVGSHSSQQRWTSKCFIENNSPCTVLYIRYILFTTRITCRTLKESYRQIDNTLSLSLSLSLLQSHY